MAEPPSAKEFADWIEARDAIKIVAKATNDYSSARHQILDRLVTGLIQACAATFLTETAKKLSEPQTIVDVPQSFWRLLVEQNPGAADLWKTNDAAVEVSDNSSVYRPSTIYRFYGIRFNPAGIQKLLPHGPAIIPLAAEEQPEEERSIGPAVAADRLKEWAALFLKAYPEGEITEDRALSSARGMFPGKSVTRLRVRELIPARKRGRKPTPEDG